MMVAHKLGIDKGNSLKTAKIEKRFLVQEKFLCLLVADVLTWLACPAIDKAYAALRRELDPPKGT